MTEPQLPALPCTCASLRRAARAITQLYEEALRPTGLRATQFTILQALSLAPKITQGKLGQILAMDSTTLTRALTILGRRGWIAKRRGEDRREWLLRLSARGEAQLDQALPYWQEAQAQARGRLGGELADDLMKLTNKVTNVFME